jgi:hypothetical protein
VKLPPLLSLLSHISFHSSFFPRLSSYYFHLFRNPFHLFLKKTDEKDYEINENSKNLDGEKTKNEKKYVKEGKVHTEISYFFPHFLFLELHLGTLFFPFFHIFLFILRFSKNLDGEKTKNEKKYVKEGKEESA